MDEKPTYFEDNYAAKFLTGQTVFPDDARIFHRKEFDYDDVAALGEACLEDSALAGSALAGSTLAVDLTFRSGRPGVLRLIPIRPGVLRIQMGEQGAAFEETSPMLLPFPEADLTSPAPVPPDKAGEQTAAFSQTSAQITYPFGDYEIQLDRQPFCMRVIGPRNGVIFESETEKLVDRYTAPPMGLRRAAGAADGAEASAFLSWRMRSEERFFGLGEKFTRFEKTGTRATIWSADTCGSNTTDMSYKSVPALFSTAGWALLLHSSFRSLWEIGSFSYATGGMLVEDGKLDLFLILAPTLKAQVTAYTALTGRPQMLPRWAFGVWMSRAAYKNRAEMEEVADRLRAEEMPCDVFNIDPTWMEGDYYDQVGVCVCNFNWDSSAWGRPERLFADFAEKGYAICLWINPYLSEDSPAYAEAREKGYLVQTVEGSIARLEFNLAAGIVDFTNPEAKAWYQSKLIDLLKKGAAVFKVDFGDRVPEDALFYNRKNGREMHNLYVHLYSQAVYEAVEQVYGQGAVWRRPGYIGTQRYPGSWAGDTQATWEGMAGALRGGLSASFTGESFWGHDIGGFVGHQPSDELYIRWAQWGMLSPLARFHGTTPREPWHYGAQAVDIVRHYARLRYALMPYLLGYANESAEDGLPLLRPMVLEFPDEPRIDAIDDQYMLGPDLLVAPVFKAGARSRVIYLPKGAWWTFDRPGSVMTGGGFREVEAPLDQIPLFVRAGALIPRYKQPPQHLKGPAPRAWLLDIYPGEAPHAPSRRRLVIPETGYTVTIDYRNDGGTGRLDVSPAPVTLSVRLVDRRPAFLRSLNHALLQPGDAVATFSVDAAQGVSVEFRA